jgi:hypothetical protein
VFGLPGAGKSTFCRRLAEIAGAGVGEAGNDALNGRKPRRVEVLEFDQLGLGWTVPEAGNPESLNDGSNELKLESGVDSGSTFREARAAFLSKLEELLARTVFSRAETPYDALETVIFVDDNMYYASMRLEVHRVARKCEKSPFGVKRPTCSDFPLLLTRLGRRCTTFSRFASLYLLGMEFSSTGGAERSRNHHHEDV